MNVLRRKRQSWEGAGWLGFGQVPRDGIAGKGLLRREEGSDEGSSMVLGGKRGVGENVSGRGKGTSPWNRGACLWSAEAKAEPSLHSKTKHFPNKNSVRKLDFLKMQFVASFSKRNDAVPVGLVVCCFWEVILGKGYQPGFPQVIILN